MADADPDEERGARNIAGLECLHDVVTSVRGALGKLWAHAGDRAAELDLQRNSRQHFDERGISRLLGDTFAKFAIAHGISFSISALQGGSGFNKYILKPPDIVVAHIQYGELDRKTAA